MTIHAIQFGAQPMLVRFCIAQGTPTSSLVLGAELAKILGCIVVMNMQGCWRDAVKDWTLRTAILSSFVPSVTYLAQNIAIQEAYKNVDGIVFNLLNQTKVLFAALFSFTFTGRRQSRAQVFALLLAGAAGTLTSISAASAGGPGDAGERGNRAYGVFCVILASILSGLGSGITEKTLQTRNSYIFSLEMAILGCFILMGSLPLNLSRDSQIWWSEGLFSRWSAYTLIPCLTQGLGGIVVGLITKVAGGVRKSFAVICGLIFTCFLKRVLLHEPLSPTVMIAVPLTALSILLHASNPPKKLAPKSA